MINGLKGYIVPRSGPRQVCLTSKSTLMDESLSHCVVCLGFENEQHFKWTDLKFEFSGSSNVFFYTSGNYKTVLVCYSSYDFHDEYCWAGAWLYMATQDKQYLQMAEDNYEGGAAWGQSWDEKNSGCMVGEMKTMHLGIVLLKDLRKT